MCASNACTSCDALYKLALPCYNTRLSAVVVELGVNMTTVMMMMVMVMMMMTDSRSVIVEAL